MTRTPQRNMIIGAALFVLLTLEQVLFGRDTPGTAHDISVAAWVLSLGAAGLFLVSLIVWAIERRRRKTSPVD